MKSLEKEILEEAEETIDGDAILRMAERYGIKFNTIYEWWGWRTGVTYAIRNVELPLNDRYLERRFGWAGAIAYRLAHDF